MIDNSAPVSTKNPSPFFWSRIEMRAMVLHAFLLRVSTMCVVLLSQPEEKNTAERIYEHCLRTCDDTNSESVRFQLNLRLPELRYSVLESPLVNDFDFCCEHGRVC